MRIVRALSIAPVFFCVAALPAAAATDGSIGLSLAPLVGTHTESDFSGRLAPIPIPIVQGTLRSGPVELFAESLPASPAITASSAPEDLTTHLAFFDGVVRAYAVGDRLWAGAGEIVYNQRSLYDVRLGVRNGVRTFEETDTSRVAGGRYELGTGLGRDPHRFRLSVDIMPSLSGDVHGSARFFRTIDDAERGAQVESQFLVDNTHRNFSFQYGARYVNYSTRYTATGRISDHNVGFLPFVTAALHFGG